ncbi:hypothetical protein QCA50_004996 [Cerrena zonata]|uniref:Uncharacterized protein n=1 Tax=Cerrena zonata TaxID=2478898 RepID=A0AAW0GG66_9APHY
MRSSPPHSQSRRAPLPQYAQDHWQSINVVVTILHSNNSFLLSTIGHDHSLGNTSTSLSLLTRIHSRFSRIPSLPPIWSI